MASFIHNQGQRITLNQLINKFRNYLREIFRDSPKIDFQKAKADFEVFMRYDDF
jgi:hypothetical protein